MSLRNPGRARSYNMSTRLSDRFVKQEFDRRTLLAAILLLAAVTPLAAAAPTAGNVLPNGAFDEGQKHWSLHTEQGAKATFKVEPVDGNPAGHVAVTGAGSRSSHVQFACAFPEASLQPGEIYRVEFRCKSSLPRNTRVVLIEQGKPWGQAGMAREFPMAQQWQTQRACFRAKAVPCPDLKLDFFLGDTSGDVWIDDVSIVHVDIEKLTAQRASAGSLQIAAQTSTFYLDERGRLTGLRDSRAAHDLILPLDDYPAFGLRLRRGQEIRETNADLAASITHERKGDRVTFTATFPDMTVRYTYEPYGRDGLLACRIRVDNRSAWAVTEVEFPRVFCPGRLGESTADDRLLYPLHDGGIVVDPYEKMMGKSLGSTYPGPLSCQVMAFYDPAGGVVVASLDPTGEIKRLWAKGDLNMSLGVTQLRPVTPGADVVVDQPVVVGAFKGTWHDAAEVYRRWAQQQSFCATPLHKNPLWPARFRNGAMVNYFSPEREDKDKKRKYCLENLNRILPELKARSGLPMITISWGWEQHGMWCSQEYFPAFPSDEDFKARGSLFDRFGTGMVMLSGYRWTFEKPWAPRGPYDGTERFNREVKPWVTCREDPATPTIVEPTGKESYEGSKYATLCRATRFTNDTISAISQRCVKAGYTVIHWDQVTSGGASQAYCLSPNHGHPPGYGRWIHTSLVGLFQRLREDCGGLSPDFALSMEEPGELYLPYLQLIQSRPYVITSDFPVSPPLTEAVPLFMYLYHEYQAGWASHLPATSTGGHPERTIAKGFSAGCMPGMLHLILYHPGIRWAPSCREMFFKCCRVYREEGLPFLLYGRMMKPLSIEVPLRTIEVTSRNKVKSDLEVPAFYHSVWQAPDGRRAVVFFNPEDTAHTVRLPDGRTVTVEARDGKLCELKD